MTENETHTEQTFLIYGEGYPDEGQSLTADALQEELAAGRLTACDLVWCDHVWRQLSDIFELEPYALPDFSDANEPEIALDLKMLPACQLAPKACADASQRRSFLRWLVYDGSGRLRSIPVLLAEAVILLALAAGLLFFAIVPGLNRLYWRPAYVLVVNPYQGEAALTFIGKQYKIAGNGSLTIPDIFGRTPRTEVMMWTPPGGKGEAKKIKVPIHANETVLVNPDGCSFFGILKVHRDGRGVSMGERSTVIAEIRAGKPPVSALKAAEVCRREGTEALLACTDDKLIRSTDPIVVKDGLNMEQLGLKRTEDYIAHHADVDTTPATLISRNLLRGVSIKDTKVFYRKGSKEVSDCEFRLNFQKVPNEPFIPLKKFGKSLPGELRQFDAIDGGAVCTVKFEEKQTSVEVKFDQAKSKVVRNQREIFGRWTYVAHLPKNGTQWNWRWTFNGKDAINVASMTIDLTNGGIVSVKYSESRPNSAKK